MTCHSTKYVRGYRFWSFMINVSGKYGKKLSDTATKTVLDAEKIVPE